MSKQDFNSPPGRPRVKVTSYRVRKGSISPTAQERFVHQWPTVGVSEEELPGHLVSVINDPAPLIVDIGPGNGISTIGMAQQESEFNTIAAEVYLPGLMKLADAITVSQIGNVRLVNGDATVLLGEHIPDGRLSGIRVFFPDPWPKSRHHKRRLINQANLELFCTKLASHGIIHIATDHDGYSRSIEELLPRVSGLKFSSTPPATSPILLERPVTKFEARAVKEGRIIREYYLTK